MTQISPIQIHASGLRGSITSGAGEELDKKVGTSTSLAGNYGRRGLCILTRCSPVMGRVGFS